MIKKCKQCNKDFKSYKCRNRKYCSHLCANLNSPGLFKDGHIGYKGQWKGGIYHHSDGYIHISSPNHPNKDIRGYVPEHVLVIEKSIKRYLKKGEIVHHINRVKDDNRLKNLKLFSSQSEHIKYEYRYSKKFRLGLKKNQFIKKSLQ